MRRATSATRGSDPEGAPDQGGPPHCVLGQLNYVLYNRLFQAAAWGLKVETDGGLHRSRAAGLQDRRQTAAGAAGS